MGAKAKKKFVEIFVAMEVSKHILTISIKNKIQIIYFN